MLKDALTLSALIAAVLLVRSACRSGCSTPSGWWCC